MSKIFSKSVGVAVVLAAAAVPLQAANPAFPGAEGPGAAATGGRGGDVYHVTNLNPDKTGVVPGSLQYGINNAPGAGRTIVFDIGGTIYLGGLSSNDTLRYGKSNITIAGQTAPGPGITIAGTGTKWTGSNVILRNVTVRPNTNVKNVTFDAFSLQLKNSIVDHVTATWFTDEGISETDAGENSTIQYASISEGLNSGGHSFGSIIATEVDGTSLSYHHNLYAHNKSRMPRVGSEKGATGALLNFSNNVVYNWTGNAGYSALDADTSAQQPSSNNFINNYYLVGVDNGSTVFSSAGDQTKLYVNGNMKDTTKNGVLDGAAITQSAWTGTKTALAGPVAVAGVNTADSAQVGYQRTLDYGGANWQNRNAIDQRIIDSVRTSTGRILNDLTGTTQAAEWALLMSQTTGVTRAANFDSDGDGMSDVWEAAHGTNPAAANHNADFDNDGYTDLEEYINDLGAWPAPNTLVFNNANANGRYAQVNNWGNLWQPSRFDAAQVNAGNVIVDAPGQHARSLTLAATAGSTASLTVNAGWIDVAQTLSIGSVGTGSVSQSGGTVRAGTSIVIGGANQAGVYNFSGGTIETPLLTTGAKGGTFNFTGGTLHADRVTFNLTNNGGTIAPGSDAASQQIGLASLATAADGPGTIGGLIGDSHFNGNLTLAAGTLQIQLADALKFDAILIDGTLALGGALDVQLLAGYVPAPGDRWLIGSAASITGKFASVTPNFGTELSGGNLFLVAVPEPGSLAVLGLMGMAAMRRRR